MDHFPVKKLLIGIVSSGKAGADAAIPVNDIDVSAKLSCSLEKGHFLKYEDTERSDEVHEYYWIDRFPEIKAAVEHKAKRFEKIQVYEVDLFADVKVAKKIDVKLSGDKKVQMYVSYCCE